MAVSLMRRDEEDGRTYNGRAWRMLLELAEKNGWEPQGTVMDPDAWSWLDEDVDEDATPEETPEESEDATMEYAEDWDGDYTANYGQRVTDEDARNLADALEKAIENGDIFDDFDRCVFGDYLKDYPGIVDRRRTLIKDFIEFCRKGSFQIF